jgi:hypothetical protein
MKLISINSGKAGPLFTNQHPDHTVVMSGIKKSGISDINQPGPVEINSLGVIGDEQADLTVHGGIEKAIYVYPHEHYSFWNALLSRELKKPMDLQPGAMGENFTITGLFEENVFVGDTLFMPDVGTARCDFPGGDAKTLYASTRKILSLPPQTRLFMCHDYPPHGRPVNFETTVAEQKAKNIHVHDGIDEAQFVAMRTTRDATLEMPMLILPAVQINIRAGELPPKESNGIAYAKIPLNAL